MELTFRERIVIRCLLLICTIVGKDYHTLNGYHELKEVWKLINEKDGDV